MKIRTSWIMPVGKRLWLCPGAGVSLSGSTAPARDKSTELTNYPTDLINSPPQQVKAQANFSFTNSLDAAFGPSSIPNKNAPRNEPHENGGAGRSMGQERDSGGAKVKLTPNRQGTPRNSFTELIGTQ